MLGDFAEKKEPFFHFKKTVFFKLQTLAFYFKGVNPIMLLAKKCLFFFNSPLIKISREIMPSDFAEKKETFFDLKK